jgi:Transglutaminase-like superfamily
MRKALLILIVLAGLSKLAAAQDFPFGQVDNTALEMKKYENDTSAHAVVLNEFGTSRIHFDNDYRVMITFEFHTKIKFFDNKEFDKEGTFDIPVYTGDNSVYEDIQDVKGVTFFTDDNGGVQKVELDPKKIFSVAETKHWSVKKFAMPGLRNGCVIEVSYKVVSPYLFNFRSWDFQSHIPKVNSEYEVHIPGFWNYNASLKGYLKLTKNEVKIERACLIFGSGGMNSGASADCSDITYGIKNIPAFVSEDFMTTEKNYKSSVNFELTDETDLVSGAKTRYTKDWKDIDYLLKTNFAFGTQLKRLDLMKERIKPVINTKTGELEKARAIYDFIKKSIKWNERSDYGSYDGIKQALENHTGNSGDINLALITALNAAGIPTEAVLLSTREHGNLNKLYPNLGEFDYVVAKADIGDKSFLLDATDPLLPFGMLPLRCLNDQGRVFSLNKPSYWMDLNLPQKEKSTSTLDFTLQEDGKLKGSITNYFIGYEAYKRRVAIKKFNTTDEYVEDLNNKLPKFKILKSEITNLDSLDLPLGEKYDAEINVYDKLSGGKLSFNPFFLHRIITNPFKLANRTFPVDWGMASDNRVILIIHLPAQYMVETPPQIMSMALPNDGGKFLTSYEPDNNTFTFSSIIQFNKSIYSSEEYPYLKELYNKIIQSEKAELIFKKK